MDGVLLITGANSLSSPIGGGGIWTMSGCALVTSSTGQLQCRCLHQGTYAVLDVSH